MSVITTDETEALFTHIKRTTKKYLKIYKVMRDKRSIGEAIDDIIADKEQAEFRKELEGLNND